MNDKVVFKLAENKDYVILLETLKKNPQLVIEKGPFGSSLLHYIAEQAPIEVIQRLIEMKADIHAKNDEEETPVWWAIESGNFESADYLLELGAGLDIMNKDGNFLIHNTAMYDGPKEIDYLLQKGVPIDQRNSGGATALHLSATNKDSIEFLISRGADVDARDKNGTTPLQYAIGANIVNVNRKLEGMECLLQHGAEINTKVDDGLTSWTIARQYFYDDYVKLLERYGEEE